MLTSYVYVRATCFDLVGHPQASQENRSKSYFLDLFPGGPEDDLLVRNMSP